MPSKNRIPAWKESFGFTLLELSLALVIIGLLVGGILGGKELIRAAAIRKQIKQVETYTLAYNLFKQKYKCIPGDCPKAADFFPGAENGNGNNKLESTGAAESTALDTSSDSEFDLEKAEFFDQLRDAELIPRDYSTVSEGYPETTLAPGKGFVAASDFNPAVAFPPYVNQFTSQSKTYFAMGEWDVGLYFSIGDPEADWGWKNDKIGLFTPFDMYAIDTKMDDGNPQTGKLLAGSIEWTNQYGGTDGYCLDNSPHSNTLYTAGNPSFPNSKWDTYLFSNTRTPCIFAWKLQ